jgi:hypothetical protein
VFIIAITKFTFVNFVNLFMELILLHIECFVLLLLALMSSWIELNCSIKVIVLCCFAAIVMNHTRLQPKNVEEASDKATWITVDQIVDFYNTCWYLGIPINTSYDW